MGVLTQQVYLPQPIYRLLPLLYFVAGMILWLVLTNPFGKFAALILLGFAVFISARRFLGATAKTATAGRRY
ncbi:MAG: hypothetical protein ACNA7J_11195 [Wenzhouxiangella sp.]